MSVKFVIIYSLTVFVASITPGPSMLLALNHGIRHGAKRTVATALGNGAATFLQAALSMAGLGAILVASETVFAVMKYAGAAYLVYVGVKTFISSDADLFAGSKGLTREKEWKDLFAEAFFVTMGNPKAIIFFTALFPQFINTGRDTLFQFAAIISILLIIAFACMMIYGFCGEKVTVLLKGPQRRRLFNRVIGGSFVGMGIGLATGRID